MIRVNLLPDETKAEINQAKNNTRLVSYFGKSVLIFIGFVLLIAGFYYYFSESLRVVNADLADKEAGITKYGATEEKAKKIAERLDTIKKIQDNTNTWSGLIKDLASVVPNGVYLNSVKIDSATSTRGQIQGYATSKKEVATLRDAMEKSNRFEYVDIENSTTTSAPGEPAKESFTITFSLQKGALK